MFIRQHLTGGIVACATLQTHRDDNVQAWVFAYEQWVWDGEEYVEPESEYVQACLYGAKDPVKCIVGGIVKYDLPVATRWYDNKWLVQLMREHDIEPPQRFIDASDPSYGFEGE